MFPRQTANTHTTLSGACLSHPHALGAAELQAELCPAAPPVARAARDPTSASRVLPRGRQQEALTLEEGQAGVQLPDAVAEGQGAVLGPGVPAGGGGHAVLFQQNGHHLPKTGSVRISTLPTPLAHASGSCSPPRTTEATGRKDTVLRAQQGNDPAGSRGFRAHAIVYGRGSAEVTGRGHVKRRPPRASAFSQEAQGASHCDPQRPRRLPQPPAAPPCAASALSLRRPPRRALRSVRKQD